MLSLQVSDRTVHMMPDPQTLLWSHYAFASEYVAEQVLLRLLTSARNQLEVFLSSSYGLSELAHVRSRLFESFVHHVLPLGGKFELRDLQSGKFVQKRLNACVHCAVLPVSGMLVSGISQCSVVFSTPLHLLQS